MFHFRKTVRVAEQPKNFIVHVSADNHFILYVNGARVGIGPASGDLAHWRYETLDLAPMMHAGDNVIGATVWNFGTSTPVAQMSSQTGFVLQGDGENEQAANTDSTWQVEMENGDSPLPVNFMAVLESYYAGPPGELIDARTYDWSWNSAHISDPGKWKKAMPIGSAAARGSTDSPTIWMLVPDPLPQMEMTRTPVGRAVSRVGHCEAKSADKLHRCATLHGLSALGFRCVDYGVSRADGEWRLRLPRARDLRRSTGRRSKTEGESQRG